MPLTLTARNIAKRYGAVVALADANISVQSGEVLALIGANGSGKSTLSKIVNGVVAFDGGQLLLDGKPVRFSSPQAAKKLGISTVFQETSLIPQMTVAENIWLTREPRNGAVVDQKKLRRETEALLALFAGTYKGNITPETRITELSPDEKQIVEILKAVSANPRLLILDEATASLDRRQVERLFELVATWKAAGTAIIFVSHRMEEIFQIADRFTVLRNGHSVGDGPIAGTTTRDLVNLMVQGITAENVVGRARLAPDEIAARPVALEVSDVKAAGLAGVSFSLHQGELLGLGGLKGQGQQSLLLALFGDIPFTGAIKVADTPAHFTHPRQAMKRGIALVPGERAKEGLLLIRSILENLQLPSWRDYGFPLQIGRAANRANDISTRLGLKMAGLDAPVNSLSGGNAQKVVIGKWLLRNPQILMLDDPTKGIDVGAKADFYKLLAALCDEGKSILIYSSDDEELIGLCDRVLVMHDGLIRTELVGESLTKQNLVAASLGATQEAAV